MIPVYDKYPELEDDDHIMEISAKVYKLELSTERWFGILIGSSLGICAGGVAWAIYFMA